MGKLRRNEHLLRGLHFDREVIILCVRWYPRYKLSFRDLVEIVAELRLDLAHMMAQRETKIQPDAILHYFDWKTMTDIPL